MAVLRGVQSGQDAREGGFAAAGCAGESGDAAGGNGQADVGEHRLAPVMTGGDAVGLQTHETAPIRRRTDRSPWCAM